MFDLVAIDAEAFRYEPCPRHFDLSGRHSRHARKSERQKAGFSWTRPEPQRCRYFDAECTVVAKEHAGEIRPSEARERLCVLAPGGPCRHGPAVGQDDRNYEHRIGGGTNTCRDEERADLGERYAD